MVAGRDFLCCCIGRYSQLNAEVQGSDRYRLSKNRAERALRTRLQCHAIYPTIIVQIMVSSRRVVDDVLMETESSGVTGTYLPLPESVGWTHWPPSQVAGPRVLPHNSQLYLPHRAPVIVHHTLSPSCSTPPQWISRAYRMRPRTSRFTTSRRACARFKMVCSSTPIVDHEVLLTLAYSCHELHRDGSQGPRGYQ